MIYTLLIIPMWKLHHIKKFPIFYSYRQRTGGHTSSVLLNTSDSTILKVQLELSSFFSWRFLDIALTDFAPFFLRHRN